MDLHEKTVQIQQWAHELGLQGCGIASAAPLPDAAAHLETWLQRGWQAGMSYMSRHTDLRADISRIVPGARSVISVCCNYRPAGQQPPDAPIIAGYAFGEDYHRVVKDKLYQLKAKMETAWGAFNARIFVDSAPVFEKIWAARCGLGWIGRNRLLVTPVYGTYVFLGELVCDLILAPTATGDGSETVPGAHCGACRRCIEACPAGALSDDGLDARRCLSYLTIEHRGELHVPLHNHLFGCDCCQTVCPHNAHTPASEEPRFACKENMMNMTAAEWQRMEQPEFDAVWHHTPLNRAGMEQIKRNLQQCLSEDNGR